MTLRMTTAIVRNNPGPPGRTKDGTGCVLDVPHLKVQARLKELMCNSGIISPPNFLILARLWVPKGMRGTPPFWTAAYIFEDVPNAKEVLRIMKEMIATLETNGVTVSPRRDGYVAIITHCRAPLTPVNFGVWSENDWRLNNAIAMRKFTLISRGHKTRSSALEAASAAWDKWQR